MEPCRAFLWLAYLGVAAARRKKAVAPPPPPDNTAEMVVSVIIAIVAAIGMCWWLKKRMSDAPSGGKVTCSLVFSSVDENMTAVWHMTGESAITREDERVLARFVPTVPVAPHKLTHNCGRTEVVRAVSQNKVFHFGWVQYLTLALKHGHATVHFEEDVPKRAVLLTALDSESRVIRCRAGATLDLTEGVAVAVVPSASKDFDMKFFDTEQFKLLGNRLGAAESFEEGRSPGARPVKSPSAKSPSKKLARAASRSDMPIVQVTMPTKQAMD